MNAAAATAAAATRVLVLGTGSIGARHLRVLAGVEGVAPVAVPVRGERAAALRGQGQEAYDTLEGALAAGVAGAVVATDTGRHASDAERLLARCPVLVEKPLAANAADAARVAEAARAAGRAAHVGCCLRFDPGLRWVRARTAALGRVRIADAECLSWLPAWRPERAVASSYAARPGEGGVLLDLVHEIDYCAWLLGDVRAVAARLADAPEVGLPSGVEGTAALLLRHEGGATTTLRLSYAARPTSRRLRLAGERGALEWDYVARTARALDGGGAETEALRWESSDARYDAQARAWVASLRGGPGEGLVPASAGVHAVAVCDAARRAHASGRWEDVAV